MESWTDNVNSNQRLSDEIFESSYFDRENLRIGTNCETFWNHKYWNRSSSSSSIVSTSREMGQLLAPYNATGSYSQNTDANQNYRLYRYIQFKRHFYTEVDYYIQSIIIIIFFYYRFLSYLSFNSEHTYI